MFHKDDKDTPFPDEAYNLVGEGESKQEEGSRKG